MTKYFLLLLLTGYFYRPASAQVSNATLIAAAVKADSLFWIAYNQCDVQGMMQFIPEDMEFYHDKGGITLGDSAFQASIKNGLCSDLGKFRLRREIVDGSGKTNPMMKNDRVYGVLMTGKHLFYLSQNGEKERADGLAEYADLWLLQDGQWKMARVFSYNHGPAVPDKERTVVPIAPSELEKYIGNYHGGKMGSITVQRVANYLTVISGSSRVDIYPASNTLFFAKDRDLTFEFAKKGSAVIRLAVRENGAVVDNYNATIIHPNRNKASLSKTDNR